MSAGPLAGITVLDLTEVWAGPFCASLLADLGATVFRIESWPRIGNTRPIGPAPRQLNFSHGNSLAEPRTWERGARYHLANRSKLALALNLKERDGRAILHRLAARADVVLDGFSTGTLDELGVGYEALSAINPRIVYTTMAGWGVRGPYASYITLGDGIEAAAGMTRLRGYPDTDATLTNDGFHPDAVTPLLLVFAINLALAQRETTGRGQRVDLSQAEGLMTQLPGAFLHYSLTGENPPQRGNTHPACVPYNCYPCRGDDRWIVITITDDAGWEALVDADPALEPLRAFGPTLADRRPHAAAIDRAIAAWTAGQDADDLTASLQARGVPAFPVLNDLDLLADPHLATRGYFETVTHPYAGTNRHPGPPWRLEGVERHRTPANIIGEHNHEVVVDILGYSEEHYRDLVARDVLGHSDVLEARLREGG